MIAEHLPLAEDSDTIAMVVVLCAPRFPDWLLICVVVSTSDIPQIHRFG